MESEQKECELARLRVLAQQNADARYDLECTVKRARERGATWGEIGSALGISTQGAHERFRTMVLD
jgi:hypothetical protein